MSWVERIIEVTRAQPAPREIDWAPVEAELGTALPADYRQLCESFGDAHYSGCLWLLQPPGAGINQLLNWHRLDQRLAPYESYRGPGRPGLLTWGGDMREYEYYWLADATVDPETWPVVARRDGVGPWHRYETSLSEFLYRVLTDHDLEPFTVAETTARPFLLPEDAEMITTVEEWNRWAGW